MSLLSRDGQISSGWELAKDSSMNSLAFLDSHAFASSRGSLIGEGRVEAPEW